MQTAGIEALTVEQQRIVHSVGPTLESEFGGTFGPETVERLIVDSILQLAPTAKITSFLPVLVERFTRDRLRALARADGLVRVAAPSVLFLCVHNAGRSQMAATWLRHLAGERVTVYSGGSEPASGINLAAVDAMAELGIDITDEFPKPWTDEVVRAADVVVTMGCGDACPLFPGTRYEDWQIEDPDGQDLGVVRQIRDDIRRRVEDLIESLGLPST